MTNTTCTETRIDRRLRELRAAGQKGFIAFVTAGDPSLSATVEIVRRLEEAGADIVELGIPFSDPLADGRVNQQSATRALAAGTTVSGVLECVRRIRRYSEIPLLFFSYVNPFMARGLERVTQEAADAGVDGFVALDLPIEEGRQYADLMTRRGMNSIFLVAPTTSTARIRKIAAMASGFVYCVSREGVTGAQRRLSRQALELLRRTRRCTKLPVAIGFGISTPEQARLAAHAADAVIVGSAIVERFHGEPHNARGREAAARWVGSLVRAVKAS